MKKALFIAFCVFLDIIIGYLFFAKYNDDLSDIRKGSLLVGYSLWIMFSGFIIFNNIGIMITKLLDNNNKI